ncbi:hypothetical protein [Streptomyces sp. NPDC093676]|uniref:hypothetical protein n=1 Tax=Streptomyces sp. NPDC093676 TaxID=3366050 RepID=UPI00382A8B9F
MRALILGALIGLLCALCPALAIALATNPLVITFAAGVAARPFLARRIRRWVA